MVNYRLLAARRLHTHGAARRCPVAPRCSDVRLTSSLRSPPQLDDQTALLINTWCQLLLLTCCFRSLDTPGHIRVSRGRSVSVQEANAIGTARVANGTGTGTATLTERWYRHKGTTLVQTQRHAVTGTDNDRHNDVLTLTPILTLAQTLEPIRVPLALGSSEGTSERHSLIKLA